MLAKIAKLVTDERFSRGWGQGELAAKANIGVSTLERIEQARTPLPRTLTLQRIAMAFGKHYDPERIQFVGRDAITLELIPDAAVELRRLAKRKDVSVEEIAAELLEERLLGGVARVQHSRPNSQSMPKAVQNKS